MENIHALQYLRTKDKSTSSHCSLLCRLFRSLSLLPSAVYLPVSRSSVFFLRIFSVFCSRCLSLYCRIILACFCDTLITMAPYLLLLHPLFMSVSFCQLPPFLALLIRRVCQLRFNLLVITMTGELLPLYYLRPTPEPLPSTKSPTSHPTSPPPLVYPLLIVTLPKRDDPLLASALLTLTPQWCYFVGGGSVGPLTPPPPFASRPVHPANSAAVSPLSPVTLLMRSPLSCSPLLPPRARALPSPRAHYLRAPCCRFSC